MPRYPARWLALSPLPSRSLCMSSRYEAVILCAILSKQAQLNSNCDHYAPLQLLFIKLVFYCMWSRDWSNQTLARKKGTQNAAFVSYLVSRGIPAFIHNANLINLPEFLMILLGRQKKVRLSKARMLYFTTTRKHFVAKLFIWFLRRKKGHPSAFTINGNMINVRQNFNDFVEGGTLGIILG